MIAKRDRHRAAAWIVVVVSGLVTIFAGIGEAGAVQILISDDDASSSILLKKSENTVQSGYVYGGTGDCHGDAGCDTYGVPTYAKQQAVTITAKADKVVISAIVLNRGNCKVLGVNLPLTLSFGESATLPVTCNLLEAVVETNKGPAIFRWED